MIPGAYENKQKIVLDLIKPNREWKLVAKDFGGTFKSGGLSSATQMQISKYGLTFNIKTSYSNDNIWLAKTIIYCSFHYQQECSIEIMKNFWTSIVRKNQGILKVTGGQDNLKQELNNKPKLNAFRLKWKSFKLIFKTEGIIAENYEVLPIIELKLNGFIIQKEDFEAIFEMVDELAKELLQRKIISLKPNTA